MKNVKNWIGKIGMVLFLFVSMTACVVRPSRPAPPAVRVEAIPSAPSPRHHWVQGHYQWRRGHYVWVGGRYRR